MALGRNRKGGLDLSGVGKSSRKVSGGRAKNTSGFTMAPHKTMPKTGLNPGITSKNNYHGAFASKPRERRVPTRTLVIVLAVVVAAFALAGLVGYVVYQQTVKGALKADVDPEAMSAVLAPAEQESPYWLVLAGTDASSAEEGRGRVISLALAYVSPENKSLSALWIPVNTRIYVDGYGYREIRDAFELGEEGGLCSAVAKLANVDVTHYLEVNRLGMGRLVEQLGIEQSEITEGNPQTALVAISKKVFGSSSEQLETRAGYLDSCIATDMDAKTLLAACSVLRGMDIDNEIYQEAMPCNVEDIDGKSYSIVNAEGWNTMISRVSSGMTPVATQKELGSYDSLRANNVIDIWNGVGVTGVAKDCADVLKKRGWTVESTGNAAQFVYEETLVVYKDNGDEDAAKLVVSDLGQGRVVRSAFRYSFEGDVLVVVGKDYQPH